MGGERDIRLNLTSGAAGTVTADVALGILSFSQTSGAVGSAVVVWDRSDGSSNTNHAGLGGISLTTSGDNSFLLGVNSMDQAASVTISVFSSAANSSSFAASALVTASLFMVFASAPSLNAVPPDILWSTNRNAGGVNAVAISPDSQAVVAAGEDTIVKVWHAANGKLLRLLTNHTSSVLAAAFSPSGEFLD